MNRYSIFLGLLLVAPLVSYAGRDSRISRTRHCRAIELVRRVTTYDKIKDNFIEMYVADRPNGTRFYACKPREGTIFCYFESGDRRSARTIDSRWFVMLKKAYKEAQR